MVFNRRHNKDEQRDQNDGDPGAVAELGHQYDEKRNSGSKRAKSVNEHTVDAPRGVGAFPMDHHARLGERERKESADSKEWNEAIGDPAEHSQ